MLKFDERGNLKPYGLVKSSIEEMKTYFVDNVVSVTRKTHFEKYLKYSNDLKSLSGGADLTQWIDGSFLSMKADPRDIDLVTFLSLAQCRELGKKIENFKPHTALSLYGVDAYILEVHSAFSKYYSHTQGNRAYWNMMFSGTKPNRLGRKHKKGFIEIIF